MECTSRQGGILNGHYHSEIQTLALTFKLQQKHNNIYDIKAAAFKHRLAVLIPFQGNFTSKQFVRKY